MSQPIADADMNVLRLGLDACFQDPSIKLYFDRNLVDESKVKKIMLSEPKLSAVAVDTGLVDLIERRVKRDNARRDARAKLLVSIKNRPAVFGVIGLIIGTIALLVAMPNADEPHAAGVFAIAVTSSGIVLLCGLFVSTDLRSWPTVGWVLIMLILFAIVVTTGYVTEVLHGVPVAFMICWCCCFVVGFVGRRAKVVDDGRQILLGYQLAASYVFDDWVTGTELRKLREQLPNKLIPYVHQVITEKLGPLYWTVLVEQDVSGLRRIRTLSRKYLIKTNSERLVQRRLRQINGGAIALAGQRGAGKSTVLTRVMSRVDDDTVKVLVPAPAEYEAHEFLRNLFQEVCTEYLRLVRYPRHDTMIDRLVTSRDRLRRVWDLGRWLISVAVILTVGIAGAVGLFRDMQAGPAFARFLDGAGDKAEDVWTWAGQGLARKIIDIALVVAALLLIRRRWRPPKRQVSLPDEASQYLYKLRINHTMTRGFMANVPFVKQGPAMGLSRSRSITPVPFTFPELVSHLRSFLAEVAKDRPVVIGIDEVDRIGAVDQVEQFVRDIKTVFGVENCWFLVTVADDVGALFAQRTLSGGNVFDSAFDDVIEIEPLSLDEARNLLQRRAAGFTEPFVWLLFSLSGGFPRELLRLARRLVDLNQEAYARMGLDQSRPAEQWLALAPKIHDLAAALVHDETLHTVRAVRRRLGSLGPGNGWTGAVEQMQQLVRAWPDEPPVTPGRSDELRRLAAWLSLPRSGGTNGTGSADADQVLRSLGSYLNFASTVLDTFSESHIARAAAGDGEGGIEYLAVIRREIGISPKGSRTMLQRYRTARQLPELAV